MASTFDGIELKVREAAATALNQFADAVYADSEPEVPLEAGELKASALYPGNDPASRASAENLVDGAMVSYNTVYAAAQHEGFAEQHRMHPVVPLFRGWSLGGVYTDTSKIDEHDIMWVVKKYSEIGTKSHFLSDPLKAKVPQLERFVALSVAAVLK